MLIGNLWSSLNPSASNVQAIYWRSCGVDRWRGAIRGLPQGGIECLPHIWERGECRQQLYPKEVRILLLFKFLFFCTTYGIFYFS